MQLFEDSSVSPSLSQRSHNPASPSEFAMSSYTIAQLEVALQGMDHKIQDALVHGTIFETIEQNANGLVWQHVQNSKDIYLPCLLCIAIQRRIFAMSKSSQSDVKKVFDRYGFVTNIIVSAAQFKTKPDWQVRRAEFLKEQRAARNTWEKRVSQRANKEAKAGQEVRQFNQRSTYSCSICSLFTR